MSRPPVLPGAPRPLLFAHRGYSALAPENSMAAFRLARDRGVPGVELDVHLTADGKLVVIHDHDTGRVAGGRAEDGSPIPPGPAAKGRGLKLESSPWSAIREADIGSWKGAGFASERPPLLAELLEELGGSVYWDIELKNELSADYGLEKALAELFAALPSSLGLEGRIIVSSFNPVSLARFGSFAPGIPTAIIWSGTGELPWYLRHGEGRWLGRADLLKPAKEKVRASSSFRWRRLEGYEVLPWTVDEAAEGDRLLGLRACGLISNDPLALSAEARASLKS